jgi:hypothetical protein
MPSLSSIDWLNKAAFQGHMFNLENAVGSRKSAQAIDSSSYMKKVLITNKLWIEGSPSSGVSGQVRAVILVQYAG